MLVLKTKRSNILINKTAFKEGAMDNSKKSFCRPASEFRFNDFLSKVRANGLDQSDSFDEILSMFNSIGETRFLDRVRVTAIDPYSWNWHWIGNAAGFDRYIACVVNIVREMGFIRDDLTADLFRRTIISSQFSETYDYLNYYLDIIENGEYETFDPNTD